jgi:hypothetical protein
MLAFIVVDRGFEPWSGQTNDYKIGICCFSGKHAIEGLKEHRSTELDIAAICRHAKSKEFLCSKGHNFC